MTTYLELKEQAARLLLEAEKLRHAEIESVISDIRQKMEVYGLTVHDLGLSTQKRRPSKHNSTVKYRGPNGQEWVGGRGRKPDWILAALKAGKDIEKEFGI